MCQLSLQEMKDYAYTGRRKRQQTDAAIHAQLTKLTNLAMSTD